MGVVDLVTRADAICKKYEKYDVDKKKDVNTNLLADDAFARLYGAIDADLDEAIHKAEGAAMEKSRARAVAMNAEIRRTKARLIEQLPKLQRLAYKKVKGLSNEELETRGDLVSALKQKIEEVPDGSTAPPNQTNIELTSALPTGIKIYSDSGKFDSDFFQATEETNQFRQEHEIRKKRQDEGLDEIAEGLYTLKDMAHNMNEELDRQVPLVDEIEDKVDKATSDLKSTNVKLKDTITQRIEEVKFHPATLAQLSLEADPKSGISGDIIQI